MRLITLYFSVEYNRHYRLAKYSSLELHMLSIYGVQSIPVSAVGDAPSNRVFWHSEGDTRGPRVTQILLTVEQVKAIEE